MKNIFYSILFILLSVHARAYTAHQERQKAIAALQHIADTMHGKIGIAVLGLDFGDTILVNDSVKYPMLSVYKFPLAIAILKQVDEGKLSLSRQYTISRSKLMPNTWSPMLNDFTTDQFNISLQELLRYSVSKSDNNACDLLFGIAGGTKPVDEYLRKAGIKGISVAATEREMSQQRDIAYTNWCHPSAMAHLLKMFYAGKLLSSSGNAALIKLMTESENSPNRLKGLLPAYAQVAHKTGTGNTYPDGTTCATNDVGIVTMPNGRHYAIAVYISDYTGGIPYGEKAIADVSRIVWDYYSARCAGNSTPTANVKILKLYDSARNGRKVDVAIYKAKESRNNNKVVILNHGYDPGNEQPYLGYSYIANDLAVKGYLVLSVLHDLPADAPIPREGNLQLLRRPFWETGVQNILFAINAVAPLYPKYNFDKVSLIGHSNGGDIAALFATKFPGKVNTLITLDNRRMALPRAKGMQVLSLRSSDMPADNGVLPTLAEEKEFNIQVVNLPATQHNDMDDDATAAQREEMLHYIDRALRSSSPAPQKNRPSKKR